MHAEELVADSLGVADGVVHTAQLDELTHPKPADQERLCATASKSGDTSPISFGTTLPSMKQVGQYLVCEAMKRCHDNQAQAARMIGISRQALNKRLQKLES